MAAAAGCRVTVEASADASGNPASNRRLVAGRARAAVLRLREAGIADGNIEVVHLSPGSAPTEQARQRLRSVVLRARPG
jgi:outer membrane protein OmpA-like peptidoglycan-associated protein